MASKDDEQLIDAARMWCVTAHAGQNRANGKPYHTHPFAVADLVREYGQADAEIIAAAYLHDVLEDTKTTRKQLAEEFGKRVARLVEEMTIDQKDQSFESKQQALLAAAKKMSQDAKWIKLADRLHNLREKLPNWPEEKRRRYSQASLNLLEALKPWPSMKLAEEVRRLAGEFAD